jgi:hypothetical protein
MNREAASGRLFFYREKVKKHGPALGWGLVGRTVPGHGPARKRDSEEMFPTKAGEFATAPRQERTVVPHPLIRIPLAPSAGGSSAIENREYDFRAWLWLRSLHKIVRITDSSRTFGGYECPKWAANNSLFVGMDNTSDCLRHIENASFIEAQDVLG